MGQICYPAPLKSALCFCRHQAIAFYNRRTDPCPWGASCCYACMVVVTVQHLGAMPGCVSAGIAACLPVPGTTGVPRSPPLDRCDRLLSHLDPICITIPAHWHQTACGVDPTLLTGANSQQIRALFSPAVRYVSAAAAEATRRTFDLDNTSGSCGDCLLVVGSENTVFRHVLTFSNCAPREKSG
jgi:hypothetical protein